MLWLKGLLLVVLSFSIYISIEIMNFSMNAYIQLEKKKVWILIGYHVKFLVTNFFSLLSFSFRNLMAPYFLELSLTFCSYWSFLLTGFNIQEKVLYPTNFKQVNIFLSIETSFYKAKQFFFTTGTCFYLDFFIEKLCFHWR